MGGRSGGGLGFGPRGGGEAAPYIFATLMCPWGGAYLQVWLCTTAWVHLNKAQSFWLGIWIVRMVCTTEMYGKHLPRQAVGSTGRLLIAKKLGKCLLYGCCC